MRTLSEVIKALEMCTADECVCIYGCPYSELADGDDGCEYHAIPAMQKDALHYLKMYKELADDSEAFAQWKENPPLPWNELKQMEGRPVWFEWTMDEDYDIDAAGSTYQEWLFVYHWRGKDKQILIATNSEGRWNEFYAERQGTGWQAYRKERE